MISGLFWIVPIGSISALVFAYYFFKQMMKESEGNDVMKKIARYVRQGAMAYLKQQYKVVGVFFLIFSCHNNNIRNSRLWIRITKSVGSWRIYYRWIFLRSGWFLRDEDSYQRLSPHRQRRPPEPERRLAGSLSGRGSDGAGGGRLCAARHQRLVPDFVLSVPGFILW